MISILIVGLSLALLALSAAFVTMPRWCARSLHRHRLWALRDELADDLIAGRLPQKDQAVKELRAVLEFILHHERLSHMELRVFRWAEKTCSPATRKYLRQNGEWTDLGGLNPEAQELLRSYRERIQILTIGLVMLGSWSGVLTVAFAIPKIARERRYQEHDGSSHVRVVVRIAVDDVAASSKLGQSYRDILEQKTFIPSHAGAPISAAIPCR